MNHIDKNVENKIIKSIGLALLLCIPLITFVFGTGCDDMKVFQGAAHQADFLGGGILNKGFNLWDTKGGFFRLQMYLLYKVSSTLCGFPSYAFEVVFFAVYVFFLLLLLLLCNYWIRGDWKSYIYLALCFLSTGYGCRLQPEMTNSVLALLAFSVYIYGSSINTKKKYVFYIISGVFAGSIFFYKSINILICISILAAVCINDYKNNGKMHFSRYLCVAISALVFIILALLFILYFNPNEIKNTINVTVYQKNLLSSGNTKTMYMRMYGLCFGLPKCLLEVPAILIGLLCAILNIREDIKKPMLIMGHLVMWSGPLFIVVIADYYFSYHFLIFVVPAILEVYLGRDRFCKFKISDKQIIFGVLFVLLLSAVLQYKHDILYLEKITVMLFLSMAVVLVLILAAAVFLNFHKELIHVVIKASIILICIYYINYVSLFSNNYKQYLESDNSQYEYNRKISEAIEPDEMCLFLDDGRGSYFLPNRSYLYCSYALPLQRIQEVDEIKTAEYNDLMSMAMDYQGKYVCVYYRWFFGNGRNPSLLKKLMDEYEEDDELRVWIFTDYPFIQQDESQFTYYKIFKRKK